MSTNVQEPAITYRDYAWIGLLVVLALVLVPLLAAIGLFLQFAFVFVGPAFLLAALVYAFVTPSET